MGVLHIGLLLLLALSAPLEALHVAQSPAAPQAASRSFRGRILKSGSENPLARYQVKANDIRTGYWKKQAEPEAGDTCAPPTVSGVCTCTNTNTNQTPNPKLCYGKCVDSNWDPSNCGTCGNTCASNFLCLSGSCSETCNTGYAVCGSVLYPTCNNLNNDPFNCGSCGHSCNLYTQTCKSGSCVTCTGGQDPAICDDQCVDLDSNSDNCGTCAYRCVGNSYCAGGNCQTCATGAEVCGSGPNAVCSQTTVDNYNCGTCGNVCPSTDSCYMGTCVASQEGIIGAFTSASATTPICYIQGSNIQSCTDDSSTAQVVRVIYGSSYSQIQAVYPQYNGIYWFVAQVIGGAVGTYPADTGYITPATLAGPQTPAKAGPSEDNTENSIFYVDPNSNVITVDWYNSDGTNHDMNWYIQTPPSNPDVYAWGSTVPYNGLESIVLKFIPT